jgi:N-acetylmuramoyl-L-alanine amidase
VSLSRSKARRRMLSYAATVCMVGTTVFGAVLSVENTITPVGIVIHHLAVPPEVIPNYSFNEIDRIHERRGFGAFFWGRIFHIGYHYLILPDGTIVRGRPERLRGAHALGYNNYLGVCLVGDFSKRDNPDGKMGLMAPSEEQMRSLVSLIRHLQTKYQIPNTRVVLHREINFQTECPGDRFDKDSFLKRLALSGSYSRF